MHVLNQTYQTQLIYLIQVCAQVCVRTRGLKMSAL